MITDYWHRNNDRSWVRDGWFVWRGPNSDWFVMKPLCSPVMESGQMCTFKTARSAMQAADTDNTHTKEAVLAAAALARTCMVMSAIEMIGIPLA